MAPLHWFLHATNPFSFTVSQNLLPTRWLAYLWVRGDAVHCLHSCDGLGHRSGQKNWDAAEQFPGLHTLGLRVRSDWGPFALHDSVLRSVPRSFDSWSRWSLFQDLAGRDHLLWFGNWWSYRFRLVLLVRDEANEYLRLATRGCCGTPARIRFGYRP